LAFFENLGSFWPFSSTSVLAALENEKKTDKQHLVLPELRSLKGAKKRQIFQKNAKCTLTLMSNYEIDF
jgi:hypothetical protein